MRSSRRSRSVGDVFDLWPRSFGDMFTPGHGWYKIGERRSRDAVESDDKFEV